MSFPRWLKGQACLTVLSFTILVRTGSGPHKAIVVFAGKTLTLNSPRNTEALQIEFCKVFLWDEQLDHQRTIDLPRDIWNPESSVCFHFLIKSLMYTGVIPTAIF